MTEENFEFSRDKEKIQQKLNKNEHKQSKAK